MNAMLNDATFRTEWIKWDLRISMDYILLAAWFGLVNSPVNPFRVCENCQGINVSRDKARFCSDYCRYNWNKEKLRKSGK